jgi:CBS domain-containing protein
MSVLPLMTVPVASLPVPGADPWHVAPQDPALSVMTDFRETSSVTVGESVSIDEALEHMKHTGVRSAFVVDERTRQVSGLITAYDILGEKPLLHMQTVLVPRRDVLVKDVMQRIADWRVAELAQIERSTVAAVATMFSETGLTHVPVVEPATPGGWRLRGLLSGAKIKRLLANLEPPRPAQHVARSAHSPAHSTGGHG